MVYRLHGTTSKRMSQILLLDLLLFDQDNNLVESEKQPFDVVISMIAAGAQSIKKLKKMFHAAVDVHVKALKKEKHRNDVDDDLALAKDKPSMTNKLRKEYVKAANRNKIMVSPVGLAFHEVNKIIPVSTYIIKTLDILVRLELIWLQLFYLVPFIRNLQKVFISLVWI